MATDRHDLDNPDFDLERRSAYRFGLIADLAMQCLAEMFTERHGLSVAMWQVLAIIGRFEPMFPSDVATRTAMHPDKVTRTVDSLVEAGWIERTPDLADRRRIVLRMTAKGRTTHRDIDHVRRIIESEFLDVLSDAELKAFNACMDKLETQAQTLFRPKDAWRAIVARREPEAPQLRRRPAGRAAAKGRP